MNGLCTHKQTFDKLHSSEISFSIKKISYDFVWWMLVQPAPSFGYLVCLIFVISFLVIKTETTIVMCFIYKLHTERRVYIK